VNHFAGAAAELLENVPGLRGAGAVYITSWKLVCVVVARDSKRAAAADRCISPSVVSSVVNPLASVSLRLTPKKCRKTLKVADVSLPDSTCLHSERTRNA
jgi:hypothetical protein